IDVLQVDRLIVPEDGQNDRESDRRFSRRHRHDEEGDQVGADSVHLSQRHEREVHGVEHELHAHEQHDGIPTKQHARNADREQHGGQSESRAEKHQTFRFASTTAPTMAARSRIEVTSNGTRYSLNSGGAMPPTTPWAAVASCTAWPPANAFPASMKPADARTSRPIRGVEYAQRPPSSSAISPASTIVAAIPAGPRMSLVVRPMLRSMMMNRNNTMMAPA